MSEDPSRKVYTAHEQVIATLTQARDADPRDFPFGVLVQDPWEDGDQQFFWYRTRAELEYALLDAHAFVDPDAFVEDQEDWTEARFDLDHALQDIRELRPHDAEGLDDLVNDFFCIVWIGHFEAMVDGDDAIAEDLRAELRSGDAAEETADATDPLADHELDAFVELLRAFGIDEDDDEA
ncbi:MAG: hypothetical protein AAGC46_03725 [Solirubrobacteraceae bacterium]|nr:hypothetical protein [Patulibacter sp.]